MVPTRIHGSSIALMLGVFFLPHSLGMGVSHASVPAGPPTFSNPLNITNAYQPFQVGALKVYKGHTQGARSVLVDLYLRPRGRSR